MLSTISLFLDVAAVIFTALYLVQLTGRLIREDSESYRWSNMRETRRSLIPAALYRKRI